MSPGDTVEWKGVNKSHRAQVTESDEGILVARTEDGHSFPLLDLLGAASLRVVDNS